MSLQRYAVNNIEPSNKTEICFITSLIDGVGNSNSIDEFSIIERANNTDDTRFHYLMFSNVMSSSIQKPYLDTKSQWTMIPLTFLDINENICNNLSPYEWTKWIKFKSWIIINNTLNIDCNVVFHSDAFYKPSTNATFWKRIAQKVMNDSSGIILVKHPKAESAFHELDRILLKNKDTKNNVEKSKAWLKKVHMLPREKCFVPWADRLGYNPKCDTFIKVSTLFWNEYNRKNKQSSNLSIYYASRRDQPLLSYVLWKERVTPLIFTTTELNNFINNGSTHNHDAKQYFHANVNNSVFPKLVCGSNTYRTVSTSDKQLPYKVVCTSKHTHMSWVSVTVRCRYLSLLLKQSNLSNRYVIDIKAPYSIVKSHILYDIGIFVKAIPRPKARVLRYMKHIIIDPLDDEIIDNSVRTLNTEYYVVTMNKYQSTHYPMHKTFIIEHSYFYLNATNNYPFNTDIIVPLKKIISMQQNDNTTFDCPVVLHANISCIDIRSYTSDKRSIFQKYLKTKINYSFYKKHIWGMAYLYNKLYQIADAVVVYTKTGFKKWINSNQRALNAIMSGRPTLIQYTGHHTQFIDGNYLGSFVNENDFKNLVARIANNGSLLKVIQQQGFELIKKYDHNYLVHAYVEMFDEILNVSN